MAKGIINFFRETKQEALKVTWPSRKETVTTTILVFIMLAITSIILLVTDSVISKVVQFILNLGN